MRNNLGQYTKGSKPVNGFKKRVVPKTAFKKGRIPWNKSKETYSSICKTCSEEFYKPYEISRARFAKRIYCSVRCRSLDPERLERFTKLMSKPYSPERKERHSSFFKKGTESHRWIADRSQVKTYEDRRSDTLYKGWRLKVYKRDNWKCRINNSDCKGRLESHHILNWKEYPDLRYEINNGITLCVAHHPRKRAEEKRLESYFMELVSVSKE